MCVCVKSMTNTFRLHSFKLKFSNYIKKSFSDIKGLVFKQTPWKIVLN